jgi:hypothetical protein
MLKYLMLVLCTAVATGEALKATITTLGPLVLPISEQMLFAGPIVRARCPSKRAALIHHLCVLRCCVYVALCRRGAEGKANITMLVFLSRPAKQPTQPALKHMSTVLHAAGEALKANITTLGPLVLPISEQMLFVCCSLTGVGPGGATPNTAPNTPCSHTRPSMFMLLLP